MPSEQSSWRFKYGNGPVRTGPQALGVAVARWHIMRPLLAAKPGSKHFIPILEVPEYSNRAYKSAKLQAQISIIISAIFTISMLLVSLFSENQKSVNLALSGIFLTLYFLIDYHVSLANINLAIDRSRFFTKIVCQSKSIVLIIITLMILVWIFQNLIDHLSETNNYSIVNFGLMYNSDVFREWWRLLIGPYFHSGFPHWVTNTLLLTLTLPIACKVSMKWSVCVFVLGNLFTALCIYISNQLDPSGADGFVGISGGIYAIFAFIFFSSLFFSSIFPKKFFCTVMGFIILSFFLSFFLSEKVSNLSHVYGIIFGIFAFFLFNKSSSRSNVRQEKT